MSEQTEQAGRLIQGLWLPFFEQGAALEIRRDCPGPGHWTVTKRWPNNAAREVEYVFDDAKAERRAWRQYYLCEAEIARERAERFYGEE